MRTAVHHSIAGSRVIDHIAHPGQNGIVSSFVASQKRYLFVKRGLDILASVIVIAGVMSWLFPLVAFFIIMDSAGPVFFRQKRMGRKGKIFYCIKFRTMRQNEEADELPAAMNDERVTSFGRLLRRTNIDELPQFINVLLGHMSIVGPRPHMITDCIRFSFVIPAYSLRNLVRPGITGWAQVKGHHGPVTNYQDIIDRYYWDAMYVKKISIWLDAMILVKTIYNVMVNLVNTLKPRQKRKNTDSTYYME